jgi:hypothetical protein
LFDGQISVEENTDDIRDYLKSANEAFAAMQEYLKAHETFSANSDEAEWYYRFKSILDRTGCVKVDGECLDIANPVPSAKDILSGYSSFYVSGHQVIE